jgi:hypothetical protein
MRASVELLHNVGKRVCMMRYCGIDVRAIGVYDRLGVSGLKDTCGVRDEWCWFGWWRLGIFSQSVLGRLV